MTRRALLHLSIDGEIKKRVETALEGKRLSFSRLVELLLLEWLAKETRKNGTHRRTDGPNHPTD